MRKEKHVQEELSKGVNQDVNQECLINPAVTDHLTEILREGARRMLAMAIEAEVEEFVNNHQNLKDAQGHQAIVRNGYLPERDLLTGLGLIPVTVPRVRDQRKDAAEPIRFTSGILPKYLRKTKNMEELIPWLYLKGISTNDFPEAHRGPVGSRCPRPLPPDHLPVESQVAGGVQCVEAKRPFSETLRLLVGWGVYLNTRMEERTCVLVIIGATQDGTKELLALEDGFRESEQSWKEVLLDLKQRGLTVGPLCAVGDGALGFWKALLQIFGKTHPQRCWMHKTANILNYLPKSVQGKAKDDIHEIWMAETKEDAEKAFDHFLHKYQAKYPKATDCLKKDREALLTFYDFPAEHWKHLRTTNPVESTLATVRLRTDKTKNCGSRVTVLSMVLQLFLSAEKRWRRLNGVPRLAEVVEGVIFVDGIRQKEDAA
ncbi:MAG TPA: IS256 family transposase [Atribacteraceae bacterium]|nr:IS256 family transposase [Atribacteraceae bacterium]